MLRLVNVLLQTNGLMTEKGAAFYATLIVAAVSCVQNGSLVCEGALQKAEENTVQIVTPSGPGNL